MGLLGGLLGGLASFGSAKALQEDSQQFQTSFYKQRYQRQLEDMRKAGLNPILSYQTGVPGTAGGGIASAGGLSTALTAGQQADAAQSQATSAKGLRGKQGDLTDSMAALNNASARLQGAQADLKGTELQRAQLIERIFREIGSGTNEIPSARTLFERTQDFLNKLNSDGAPTQRRTGPKEYEYGERTRHESFNKRNR